jgi:hypothetical protein
MGGGLMKIRIGFVSNSSSSSYVVITSKDNLDKIISKFKNDDEKSAIKGLLKYATTVKKLGGVDIVAVNFYDDNGEGTISEYLQSTETDDAKDGDIVRETIAGAWTSFLYFAMKDEDTIVTEQEW